MDQSNNVCLRWNKHQTTLVSVFDALLDSDKLTDCTISAEGRQFRAHRIILSACSPYLEELFTDNFEKHPIIILHDVKYNIVKAVIDFMYRGELDVPENELSGVLKLCESLQIRGLAGSGCVDNVNMQGDSGSSAPSVPPETLPSQPASVSCFNSGPNEPEGKVQPFRECPATVSPNEGRFVGVDTISKSTRKREKRNNYSGTDKRAAQNTFEKVFTPDCERLHQLSSQWEVLPTKHHVSGKQVYSPNPRQPVSSELQNTSGEMAVAGNKHCLIAEAVLPDKTSTNLSAQRMETALEIKCEVLESRMEIVEDLTLDDSDDGGGADDYDDDSQNAGENLGKFRRVTERRSYEKNFRTHESNIQHSPSGSDYLSNVTLTASHSVLHNQFICHSCGKSYGRHDTLYRHMKYECGKERKFKCPNCSFRCARRDNLKAHVGTRRCQNMREKYADRCLNSEN